MFHLLHQPCHARLCPVRPPVCVRARRRCYHGSGRPSMPHMPSTCNQPHASVQGLNGAAEGSGFLLPFYFLSLVHFWHATHLGHSSRARVPGIRPIASLLARALAALFRAVSSPLHKKPRATHVQIYAIPRHCTSSISYHCTSNAELVLRTNRLQLASDECCARQRCGKRRPTRSYEQPWPNSHMVWYMLQAVSCAIVA